MFDLEIRHKKLISQSTFAPYDIHPPAAAFPPADVVVVVTVIAPFSTFLLSNNPSCLLNLDGFF